MMQKFFVIAAMSGEIRVHPAFTAPDGTVTIDRDGQFKTYPKTWMIMGNVDMERGWSATGMFTGAEVQAILHAAQSYIVTQCPEHWTLANISLIGVIPTSTPVTTDAEPSFSVAFPLEVRNGDEPRPDAPNVSGPATGRRKAVRRTARR